MITDQETNFVYFSEKIIEKGFIHESENDYKKIIYILDNYEIEHELLKDTADIWCRDYMPIQTNDNSLVQFKYQPSYLQDYLDLQSDPRIVCEKNKINPEFYYDINLDGGNVVKWKNKIIVTERIYAENKIEKNDKYGQLQLIQKLEKKLNVEVLTIPVVTNDFTGHADGYVRFYDDNTLMFGQIDNEYKYWQNGFDQMIKRYGFKTIPIPCFLFKDKKYDHPAIGCYVNFLEIGNLIILPVFDVKNNNKDDIVVKLFKDLYPERFIEPININPIGVHGGLMNCISWNIIKQNNAL
jgi:agmatine deiminase